MIPIDFEGRNVVMGQPTNWDEATNGRCNGLPANRDNAGNIISVWQPSAEERIRIAAGQNIVLTCFTVQPPVTLSVAAIYDKETVIRTDSENYKALLAAIERPPSPDPELRKLMNHKPAWDKWEEDTAAAVSRARKMNVMQLANLRDMILSPPPFTRGDDIDQPKLSLLARIKRALFGARSTPDTAR